MINFLRGIFKARPDIIGFQVGKIAKNFALRHTGRQQIKHVLDADAHPANARPSAALAGIERDAFRKFHASYLTLRMVFLKQSFIRVSSAAKTSFERKPGFPAPFLAPAWINRWQRRVFP